MIFDSSRLLLSYEADWEGYFYARDSSGYVDLSSWLREAKDGIEIDLVVSPSSPRSEVQGLDRWRKRLVVKVRAPPEKGEANEEVEAVIARLFGAKAELVWGHTSRMKSIVVHTSKQRALEVLEGLDARP